MPPDVQSVETQRAFGVGPVQRMLILRTFPAYANMSPEQLAVTANYTRERFHEPGTLLQRRGELSSHLHFVVTGAVELRRGDEVLRRFGPKSVVGGIGALARMPHAYDVVAVEQTITLEMPVEDIWDVFEDHFPMLRAVMGRVALQVIENRQSMGPNAGYSDDVGKPVPCPDRPLDLVERMARLRASMSFAQSRLDAIAELARECREERHAAGSVLWREGERMDSFYLVVSGVVSCVSQKTGQTFRFGPGDAVGVLDALAHEKRWYTATVTERTCVLRVDCETLFDLFEDQFELAQDMLAMMARSIMEFYAPEGSSSGSSIRPPPTSSPTPPPASPPPGADGVVS